MLPSKWENLSRCSTKIIYFCKKLPLTLDCGQSKYSHYIFNFRRAFYSSFPMLFPKAPASWFRKILNWFLLHCTSIFMSSKSVSQIFKILFQTGDINILVSGQLPPEENCPPVRVGVSVKFRVSYRVGGKQTIASEDNSPMIRVRVSFGVGGRAIFLGGNCPRTQYFCPSWDLF